MRLQTESVAYKERTTLQLFMLDSPQACIKGGLDEESHNDPLGEGYELLTDDQSCLAILRSAPLSGTFRPLACARAKRSSVRDRSVPRCSTGDAPQ